MKFGIKKDKNWARFSMLLDPKRFKRELERNVSKANTKIGRIAKKQIKDEIKGGQFEKNADLTVAIKGADAPLRGVGKEIKTKRISWDKYFVGVKKDNAQIEILKAIHDGTVIQVTDRMRGMFRILWYASIGNYDPGKLTGRAAELWGHNKKWYPLKDNTTNITIPARPFIKEAFDDIGLKNSVKTLWSMAIQEVFKK